MEAQGQEEGRELVLSWPLPCAGRSLGCEQTRRPPVPCFDASSHNAVCLCMPPPRPGRRNCTCRAAPRRSSLPAWQQRLPRRLTRRSRLRNLHPLPAQLAAEKAPRGGRNSHGCMFSPRPCAGHGPLHPLRPPSTLPSCAKQRKHWARPGTVETAPRRCRCRWHTCMAR